GAAGGWLSGHRGGIRVRALLRPQHSPADRGCHPAGGPHPMGPGAHHAPRGVILRGPIHPRDARTRRRAPPGGTTVTRRLLLVSPAFQGYWQAMSTAFE